MDLNELLSGTEFEGVSPGELLAWARMRSHHLLGKLPQSSELAHLLPRDAFLEVAQGSRGDDVSSSSNEEVIVVELDTEVELVDDEPEIEPIGETGQDDRAERVTPPAPPPLSAVAQDDRSEYDSPVLSRENDVLEFGIPRDEDDSDLVASISQELLFSPEERESIGFAIDDALSAAIVEGIPPEESWKFPMEIQDMSGFQQLGQMPQAPFAEPAPDPSSSGSFERGIPDESGTFRTDMVVGDDSGAFQAASASRSVASLAFLRDDDD